MSNDQKGRQPRLERLENALAQREMDQVRRLLRRGLPPADVAQLLESIPPRERDILWEQVDNPAKGEILQYLNDDIQTEFLNRMDASQLLVATQQLDNDDAADLLQRLPHATLENILSMMTPSRRASIEMVLSYPEDTAGGLMDTNTITIRPEVTLDVVLRYLRRHRRLPESTDNLLVVTRHNELIGVLPINRILVSAPGISVREIMDTDVVTLTALMHEDEVASIFERRDLISAPVISADNRLLGRITIDDVVDVIRENSARTMMSMAGLEEEEDTFAPVLRTSRRRAVWLGINLIAATIVSIAIGFFEDTIQQIAALAVLMPIVSSMGGIAGSQTLTVLIRGLALGHVSGANVRWLVVRELLSGSINGVLWAVIVAVMAVARFHDMTLGAIIAMAMVINLLVAALAGTLIPVILKKLSIDPALSGGVLLTTITDVVGFVAFLGLATAMY
ncbi:magnesium transporter [Kushneria marisflavi]|uniref:Magnesium transporter MgtE n=1 Tax=Kushneria marisflavi TaxID=157779 RepID=A0A240UT89_9GAMM|nr:magnesium transporter [Kushneria marisflavi]ART64239.1 magnesium transporter [Kushneria marisflavi]RKD76700.1 Mg2+ transporter MgtE [Kushneria marisflavi]